MNETLNLHERVCFDKDQTEWDCEFDLMDDYEEFFEKDGEIILNLTVFLL